MRNRITVTVLTLALALFASAARAEQFSFTTGSPDGKLGALSRTAGAGLETETADDFVLTRPTVVSGATFHGLNTGSTVGRVEVEIYHIFSVDSDATRTPNVPTRANSPSDHEIASATRDSNSGNLRFAVVDVSDFEVTNTVVDGINKSPLQLTHGEGAARGREQEIRVRFKTPLFLPAGHYFFRPEVQVTGGNFLFLSAPRPTTSGTPFPVGITWDPLESTCRHASLSIL